MTREEAGQPITIVMRPACRVLFRIDSKDLPALEEKYHAELAGPGWWRAAYVLLGGGINIAPRPLFASSTTGEFEFLLPPGRVILHAYGEDVQWIECPIEIKPDDRELLLGTFDLPPSQEAQAGEVPRPSAGATDQCGRSGRGRVPPDPLPAVPRLPHCA